VTVRVIRYLFVSIKTKHIAERYNNFAFPLEISKKFQGLIRLMKKSRVFVDNVFIAAEKSF